MSEPDGSTSRLTRQQWGEIEQQADFQELIAQKRRFIIPATLFFLVYYFALPILNGFFPEMMSRRVSGSVNLAYVFALSQFLMAWIIAFWYVARAAGFDMQAKAIRDRVGRRNG